MAEALLSGDGGVDELGIATLSIEYKAASFTEALTIGDETFEGLHPKAGGRSWKRTPSGAWNTTVVYEGLVADVGMETFKLLPFRTEEPVETHPYLQELKDVFGGYLDSEGKLKFPEYLPDGPGSIDPVLGLVGPGGNGQASEKNKMFGWDSYFSKGLIIEHRFTTTDDPQPYIDADDTIVEETPCPWAKTPPERNWLRQLEDVNEVVVIGGDRSNGVVFEMNVRYLLSRPGGWPPTKYLLEDLQ